MDSASPDCRSPPNADHTYTHTHTPPTIQSPPAWCLCLQKTKQRGRQSSQHGWRDWRRTGQAGGPLAGYAHWDTFSLFLFSNSVLIIAILGHQDPPKIERVLMDQGNINKPWQHVGRGRGQIGCTDCFHYQGQASLGAWDWVWDMRFVLLPQRLVASERCNMDMSVHGWGLGFSSEVGERFVSYI